MNASINSFLTIFFLWFHIGYWHTLLGIYCTNSCNRHWNGVSLNPRKRNNIAGM